MVDCKLLATLFMILASQLGFAQLEDSTRTKAERYTDPEKRANIILQDAWSFVESLPEKALSYAELVEKDTGKLTSPTLLDSVYRVKAWAYGQLNNRSQTLEAHLKRQKVLRGAEDKLARNHLASAYFETAGVLMAQQDTTLAIPYYLKCVEVTRKTGNTATEGQGLLELGEIYTQRGYLDSALLMLKQGIDLFKAYEQFYFIVGYGQVKIARAYYLKGEEELSRIYRDSALSLPPADIFPEYSALTYKGGASLLLSTGDSVRALTYLIKAREIFEANTKYFYLPDTYRKLASAYRSIDADSALKYLEKYIVLNDSVRNAKNDERIAELQIEHEDAERRREIKLLNEQRRLDQKERTLIEQEKSRVEDENARQQQVIIGIIIALCLFFALLILLVRIVRVTRKQNRLIATQKKISEERSKEIADSISYAKRIQDAIVPSPQTVANFFKDAFVLYLPKDQLSGDFYWCNEVTTNSDVKLKIFSVGDCTGHGVPGALLSILGVNYLKLGESNENVNSPADALDYINHGLVEIFSRRDQLIRDGMDISLAALDEAGMILHYACAKNPIYIVREGEVITLKGDRHPIGETGEDSLKPFTNHSFNLMTGDMIYLLSDGFQDQFGGDAHKKFKIKPLKQLLVRISTESAGKQKEVLNQELIDWRGDLEQVDDVCVMGVRV